MPSMIVNGYQQNQVSHTSLENLIVLLYEGAITFTLQARKGLQNQDPVLAGTKLLRARNIVSELRNGLDHQRGGALADNLDRLYTYVHDTLLQAGREGNPALLDPVIEVLTTLKEGWKEVSKEADGRGSEEAQQPRHTTLTPVPANLTPEAQSRLSIKV